MSALDKKYYHNIDLDSNELKAGKIYNLTTTQRNTLSSSLTATDKGYIVYDITALSLYVWNGTAWTTAAGGSGTVTSVSAGTGMSFTTITGAGSVSIDTTKVPYLASGFSTGFLKWNGSAWVFDNSTYLTSAVTSVATAGLISGGTITGTGTITTSMSTGKLVGRSTAGTGVMEEITIGTGLTLSSGTLSNSATYTSPLTTKGDIFVRSTVDTKLSVGTDGQILTANSSVAEGLSWQDNYADWTSVVKHIVKNDGTGLINKGTAVYVTNSNGTNMLVGKASNTSEATSSKTMGLMQSDITTTGSTQTGFVVTEGLLGGLNTATATAGDPVWLGVSGALIYGLINKPYAPAHLVFIGIVTKVSAGSGEIFVKVQNGFELKEIHDVAVQTPSNNDGLFFETSTSLWKNKSITTILGYTPISLTSLSGTAPVIYNSGTGVISMAAATASVNGYLSSTDWTNFNTAYTNRITSLTTTGSGAATLVSNVLNIPTPPTATFTSLTVTGSSGSSTLSSGVLNVPTYTLTGLGGQPLATNLTSLAGLSYASASFVKMTGTGVFSLDTNTYITGNQTITLSGDVTGTGTTAIPTTIGTNKVLNTMLAQIATATFKGRTSTGTGNVEDLTVTEATAMLNIFSSTLKGLAPASGGGTTNFLRADGTWAVPAGGGGGGTTTNSFIIKADSGTTEGTDLYTFNGSTAKTINIVAGTNVTISKTTGTLTISSTAGSTPSSYNYIASTHFS